MSMIWIRCSPTPLSCLRALIGCAILWLIFPFLSRWGDLPQFYSICLWLWGLEKLLLVSAEGRDRVCESYTCVLASDVLKARWILLTQDVPFHWLCSSAWIAIPKKHERRLIANSFKGTVMWMLLWRRLKSYINI